MCVESECEESDSSTHLLVDPPSFQGGFIKSRWLHSELIVTNTYLDQNYEHSYQQTYASNQEKIKVLRMLLARVLMIPSFKHG